MLEVLRDTPARRRIAVLGEMLELGRWAEPLHRDVGNYAAVCGLDVLVGIRGAACHMVDAVKRAGLTADAAFFFDDPAEAGRLLRTLAQPGDAILFKGSRGVHVERALEEFLNQGRELRDVLLAVLRKTVPLLFALPGVSILDVSHGDGDPDGDAAVDRAGPVADRALARISDRPAHPRRRSAIAPQESGHADHGRLADLRVDRGADAAVVQPARSRRVGGAGGPGQLRRGGIPGRLHQNAQQAQPGADGALEAGAGSPGGAADRRAAAGDERARRLLHQHERAVLQEFQAGPADIGVAAQSVDLSAGLLGFLRFSDAGAGGRVERREPDRRAGRAGDRADGDRRRRDDGAVLSERHTRISRAIWSSRARPARAS